jgi:hypothetical protein
MRFGAAIFSIAVSGSSASKLGPVAGVGERYMETLMRRRNSEKITKSSIRVATVRRAGTSHEFEPAMLSVTLGS